MTTHSSTLAWKIPWTEELVGCGPWGHEESDTTEQLHFHFSLSCIGEGNGNPLQRSWLENPRDGGGWWAAVYGVAQSQTRLKRLSSSSSLIMVNFMWHWFYSNFFLNSVRLLSYWKYCLICYNTIWTSLLKDKGVSNNMQSWTQNVQACEARH